MRKPGAFRDYVYREKLFPSLVYRQAYDRFNVVEETRDDRDYLAALTLAADLDETAAATVLGDALRAGELPRADLVRARLQATASVPQVATFVPNLATYDQLLAPMEVSA